MLLRHAIARCEGAYPNNFLPVLVQQIDHSKEIWLDQIPRSNTLYPLPQMGKSFLRGEVCVVPHGTPKEVRDDHSVAPFFREDVGALTGVVSHPEDVVDANQAVLGILRTRRVHIHLFPIAAFDLDRLADWLVL